MYGLWFSDEQVFVGDLQISNDELLHNVLGLVVC